MYNAFGLVNILRCSTPCVYLDISRRSDVSFYYFSMFKIVCSSRHSSFILYTPSSSIVTRLSSGYILLDRDRNLYSTLVLFSHSFKHAQIPLPHAFPQSSQIVFSLSTFYTPPYDRPLAAPRFLNLYLSGLVFYLDL